MFADCDIVIAVDVSGVRSRPCARETSYFKILFNSIKVMQNAIVMEKRRHREPNILITPQIRALEFYEAAAVFEQAEAAKKQLEKELRTVLAA